MAKDNSDNIENPESPQSIESGDSGEKMAGEIGGLQREIGAQVREAQDAPEITPELISQLKSERMRTRIDKLPKQNWPDVIAKKILAIYPDREVYTIAAGISPSGHVHAGNFRDVITAFAVHNALKGQQKEARLVFSWDDYDRLRKVPKGIDSRYEAYIGMPLSEIPAPGSVDPDSPNFGKPLSQVYESRNAQSWARYFEEEFEESMKVLGIDLDYRYQTERYRSGAYDEQIMNALNKRVSIGKTLLYQMSKLSIIKKINEEKGFEGEDLKSEFVSDEEIETWSRNYVDSFYPVSLYSEFTGKDNVQILGYDGKSTMTYRCLDTNNESSIDITRDRRVKLNWKVDWAMRWQHEGVVCEPGGQDHGSPDGSYDTSSLISRSVFNAEPPVFVQYQFIGFDGHGKMSSSSGDVITPGKLLEIYNPEILKWMFLRSEPSAKFDIALGGDQIIRTYAEFDKAMGHQDQIPFREAVQIGQLTGWNPDATELILEKMDLKGKYTNESIKTRLASARAALETYDQESIIHLVEKKNIGYFHGLEPREQEQIRKLKETLQQFDFDAGKIPDLETLLYGIPKQYLDPEVSVLTELDPKAPENQDKADRIREARRQVGPIQKEFFKNIYMLLLKREQGPRLPTFAWIMRDKFIDLLDLE